MSEQPTHIDIPTVWGVPGFRVEVRFLREVLAQQGYELVRKSELDAELARERKAFIRSAVQHITAADRETSERFVVEEAERLWNALLEANC